MKYIFNNKEYEKNNRSGRGYGNLIYDIFKYYLEQNQDKTYVQLQNVFNRLHKEFSGEKSKKKVVFNKRDFLSWLNDVNNKDNDRNKRYFGYGNYGEPLKYNGEELYFTTQWGNKDGDYGNINRFVDFAIDELDYEVEKIDEIVQTNNDVNKKVDSLKTKNIMLYGAPGVGKTHNYQKLISMIENDYSEKEIFNSILDNEEIKLDSEEFQKIKDEERIEFVTFHQSYSYEDFIEGYRPNDDNKIIRKDGVFKIISDKARKNLEDSKKQTKQLKEEKNLYKKFQEYVNDRIENGKKLKLQMGEEFYLNRFEDNKLYFKASEKSNYYKEFNLKYSDFVSINGSLAPKQTLRDISNILGTNSVQQKYAYYLQIYYDFVEFEDKPHILNGNEIEKVEQKNFYIIIDEINRGNISKIFGELITLIEEDKRDTYEVTLPYSKEKFKIPSNLYIIATMNSTDKSIATIDIALRRRFTFLKMKPNPVLVKNEEAQKLMKVLNQYIKNSSLGEDYQLGHSYFMKVKDNEDLEFIIEYKIKPLLEEYFYSDDKTPKQIIEEAFKEYQEDEN